MTRVHVRDGVNPPPPNKEAENPAPRGRGQQTARDVTGAFPGGEYFEEFSTSR